jgi:dTDP-4-dehydrorhamnose 3,5-epimerase
MSLGFDRAAKMRFTQVGASDARIVEAIAHGDERGSFARTWCARAFQDAGIDFSPAQGNTSLTRNRGTVRGMHFQRAPKADAKIVRVSLGAIHDVIVDLRSDSPTRGETYVTELAANTGRMLYVPAGFAHGFQTLSGEVIVEYLMGAEYAPTLYDGFRHDDPAMTISWPEPVSSISENDSKWPPLTGRIPWLSGRGT